MDPKEGPTLPSRRPDRLWLCLALAFLPAVAQGHAAGLSYLDLSLEGTSVQASLDLPAQDLAASLDLDADHDGNITAPEVDAQEAALRAWLGANVALSADHRSCTPATGSVTLHNAGLLTIRLRYDCPGSYSALGLRSSLGQSHGSTYSTFVELRRPGVADSQRTLLTGTDASYTFSVGGSAGGESAWRTAAEFVQLGVTHIFLGFDHILFLLALLMMCQSLRSMVGLATAFTVAHTITLSLAATKTVVLPSRFTESAIAASIAWVAIENWLYAPPRRPGAPAPLGLRLRWLLTFSFGLIHGFGFASALAEHGLPSRSVPLALGCFNGGVELGQVAIIAAAYPFLRKARHLAWYRPKGVRFASVGILALAIYWFIERAFLG